jgi:hypothetical protein
MRPTSDQDRDVHDGRPPVAHDVITDDRDAVHPESDQPSPRPWAEPPTQREPDHDGQLYVGAAHPDTDLTRDEEAHHEPIPVDEAGDPVDRDPDDHHASAAHVVHDETAHDETAHDEAAYDTTAEDERADSHESPSVMVAPLAPAQVVAVPVKTDDQAEPTADLDRDGVADEAPAQPAAEAPAEDLKPGDVPVTAVAVFLADEAVQDLRQRWREAQLGFVDDPRQSAEDVRSLVNEAIDKVIAALNSQRDELGESAGADTEQYRVTVQRSRAFFERLLSL